MNALARSRAGVLEAPTQANHLCTSGLTGGSSSTDGFRGGVDKPPNCRPLRLLLAAASPPVWLCTYTHHDSAQRQSRCHPSERRKTG